MKSQKISLIHSPFLARGGETGELGSLVPSGTRKQKYRNKIRPLEMEGCKENQKEGEDFDARWERSHLFLPDRKSLVDYRSIHSARINGN